MRDDSAAVLGDLDILCARKTRQAMVMRTGSGDRDVVGGPVQDSRSVAVAGQEDRRRVQFDAFMGAS